VVRYNFTSAPCLCVGLLDDVEAISSDVVVYPEDCARGARQSRSEIDWCVCYERDVVVDCLDLELLSKRCLRTPSGYNVVKLVPNSFPCRRLLLQLSTLGFALFLQPDLVFSVPLLFVVVMLCCCTTIPLSVLRPLISFLLGGSLPRGAGQTPSDAGPKSTVVGDSSSSGTGDRAKTLLSSISL